MYNEPTDSFFFRIVNIVIKNFLKVIIFHRIAHIYKKVTALHILYIKMPISKLLVPLHIEILHRITGGYFFLAQKSFFLPEVTYTNFFFSFFLFH